MNRRRLAAVLLAFACLSAGGCTTDAFVHGLGQTLYNAGRYVCTQSSNCDAGADGPGESANRR